MPILDDAQTFEADGQRYYQTDEGNYPSITTILSDDPEEQERIQFFWEDRIMRQCLGEHFNLPDGKLGFKEFTPQYKEANKELIESLEDEVQARKAIEMQYTQDRGILLHEHIEKFLKKAIVPSYEPDLLNGDETENRVKEKANMLFYLMHEHLSKIDNIKMQEKVLISHSLGVAGRVDCIADYDGVPSVIDFKGSSKAKRPGEREKWWLQLCFYAVAYEESTGEKISQLVVIHGQEGTQDMNDGKCRGHLYVEQVDNWYAKLLEKIAEYEERVKESQFL